MSIDELLREVRRRKLFVSNLYEGADRIWRCFIRDRRNVMPSIHHGQGASAAEAIRDALPLPPNDLSDLLD